MPTVSAGQSTQIQLAGTSAVWVKSSGVGFAEFECGGFKQIQLTNEYQRLGYLGGDTCIELRSVSGVLEYSTTAPEIYPLTSRAMGDRADSSPVDIAQTVNQLIDGAPVMLAQSGSPEAPNFAIYPEANSIDPASEGSSIWGVGWTIFPNKIGAVAKPLGPDGTNAATWSIDTGYAAATINNASVATIAGGYDHVNNQIAGTIAGGGHNFIQYNSEGHSVIGGGSYNWITAGRSFIGAGTNNRLDGTIYNAVLNGFSNSVLAGFHNGIFGGELNTINTTANGFNCAYGQNISMTGTTRYSVVFSVGGNMVDSARSIIMGGQALNMTTCNDSVTTGGNNVDQTNTTRCFTGGGENSTLNGCTYSGSVGGQGNTQTGRSSLMACAEDSNDNGARGLFTGRKAQGLGAYYQATIGCNHPTSGVLCQSMKVTQGATTTTATAVNAPAEQGITVGNTGLSTISGTCYIVARNTTDSKTAGYKVDFVAQWDGTTYFLNGVTADLAMAQIFADASSNITAPTLAFSAGQLRVRFGGTASKTVNWSASIDCVVMRA